MAYETGSSSSPSDLLTKLGTFAVAQGWTSNYAGARTSGSGNALQLTKSGHSCTFYSNTAAVSAVENGPSIGVYAHAAYSSGNGTENQASKSPVTYTNALAGPYVAYHFFAGATYLYVVVESTLGVFKHFGTGILTAFGAITTGQFCYANFWAYEYSSGDSAYISSLTSNSHCYPFNHIDAAYSLATAVRVDCDSLSPNWLQSNSTNPFYGGARSTSTAYAGSSYNLLSAPSAYTQRAILHPCMLWGTRVGGNLATLGFPPNVRWVNVTNLTNGQVVTLGSDQWKCFPVCRKNGAAGEPNSGVLGYAFKL
tara:strand:- start:970 stop:1899 length:930 start_codon:yes stop_codon:yes gene_type:complete